MTQDDRDDRASDPQIGVGPWPGGPESWPRDPRLDPRLLLEGDRRNAGIEACAGDWILEVDADERVRVRLEETDGVNEVPISPGADDAGVLSSPDEEGTR